MMAMTKEDWNKVECLFSVRYGIVKLNCDGYKITLSVETIGKLQLAIVVYVNGTLKGKWMSEDCEERRKFYQKTEKFMYGKKLRTDMRKLCKKKEYIKDGWDQKQQRYNFYWKSFSSLKKHLIANNKEIQLIEGS
jgi:hypothetical protein